MSAFIVDRAHIDLIVATSIDGPKTDRAVNPNNAWYRPSRPSTGDGSADAIGALLVNENVKSVSYRYQDSANEGLPGPTDHYYVSNYTFRQPRRRLTTVEALKALDCYEYQACEHPGWETSEAFKFIDRLRGSLIGTLPGYDKAPWGFSEGDLR